MCTSNKQKYDTYIPSYSYFAIYFMNFSASVTKYEKRGKYLRSCKWLQENNYFIAIKIYSNQVFNKYV